MATIKPIFHQFAILFHKSCESRFVCQVIRCSFTRFVCNGCCFYCLLLLCVLFLFFFFHFTRIGLQAQIHFSQCGLISILLFNFFLERARARAARCVCARAFITKFLYQNGMFDISVTFSFESVFFWETIRSQAAFGILFFQHCLSSASTASYVDRYR